MNQSTRISYVVFVVLIVLVACLHAGTFLLTSFFGYWALQMFSIRHSKSLSVILYLIAVTVIGAGLVYFTNLAYRTLPRIAEISIPAMVGFAERNGIEPPITDFASLKSTALETARQGLAIVSRYAGAASFQLVLIVAGLVVPLSVFLGSGWTANNGAPASPGSLYSAVTQELTMRFKTLYASFAKVMRAQVVISATNTGLTAAFLLFNSYPYAGLLTTLVLVCGLLPIVGNLISNAVVVGVGFTLSSRTGVCALVCLIAIHKLEYFLNSKIVGRRIDSAMWLTLIGRFFAERDP